MNKGLIAAALLFLSVPVYGEEPIKVSVAELLNPDTRMRTFQQYRIRSSREDAERIELADLDKFKSWHNNLAVSTHRTRSGTLSYLVTWNGGFSEDEWDEVSASNNRPKTIPGVTVPRKDVCYHLFSADGTLSVEGDLTYGSECVIKDLNGDGKVEIIERVATADLLGSTVPGLEAIASIPTEELEVEFLQIRSLETGTKPSFAILYNTHPKDQLVNNSWGFQVRQTKADGLWVIELGPIVAPAGVAPKVTFHWDKSRGTWTGPETKPGDHFRVLTSDNFATEAAKIAREGGLGYPLVAAPPLASAAAALPHQLFDLNELAPDRLSKPYLYRSLVGISDEQLFAFMSKRRTAHDYLAAQMTEATSVNDFWTRSPQAVALAYAHNNRPPATHSRHLLSVFNPEDEAPPTKGSLTLSDGPSGCFAPGGAYIHHLHCAPEGSYLVYAESTHYWAWIPPTENRVSFDFRKLDLTYEQARHVLQTVWWLSRIRSRQIGGTGGEFSTGGSTSDGFAAVHIISEGKEFVVNAMRAAGHAGTFLGVGYVSESYDPSAFMNLVVQLFRREIPDHLGERWKSLAMQTRWNEALNAPEPHTPEELARIKNGTKDLLRLFRERKLGAAAATEAVKAVGLMGWKDFRTEVAQLARVLPLPSEHEKKITQIEHELKQWTEKLGEKETSARAYRERDRRRSAQSISSLPILIPFIPGLSEAETTERPETPPAPASDASHQISPLSAEEEARFGEFDRLYEKRDKLRYSAPQPQRDIAELRQAIPFVLRQLDSYDDPEALFLWAQQDEFVTSFALSRLVELDRKRALELLLHCEQQEESAANKQPYIDAREILEKGAPPSSEVPEPTLSDEQRTALITVLKDKDAEYSARHRALETLVPANDSKRHKDTSIDDALRALLVAGGRGEILPTGIPMALARRLGGKAWEPLIAFAQKKPMMPMLDDALPALTFIAQREGEPYRAKVRELLAPELKEAHGHIDTTLWSIWQLDFRDLKADVERIATSGVEDYEGSMAQGGTNHRKPVKHRFHRARHLAAMWNEEDTFTRARLLVAFGMAESREFVNNKSGALEQLVSRLKAITSTLDPAQRHSLSEFVKWCGTKAVQELPGRTNAETVQTVTGALQRGISM